MDIRNSIGGFGERVRKNLDFMLEAHAEGADIHIVTELTTSLLGLIIYPYEYYKDNKLVDFTQHTMAKLAADDWPQWSFKNGKSKTKHLRDLLRRLRNAAAHYGVAFSSNARELEEVVITFTNRPDKGEKEGWEAEIRGNDLLEFTRRLADMLKPNLVS